MGKSTISTGPFSIAMLVYQRVYFHIFPSHFYFIHCSDCISLPGTLQHPTLLLQPTSWNKPWYWRSSWRVCPCWEHRLEAWLSWLPGLSWVPGQKPPSALSCSAESAMMQPLALPLAFQAFSGCHSEESSVGLWTRWMRRQRMRCRVMPSYPALWLLC